MHRPPAAATPFAGAASAFIATPAQRIAWARQRFFADGERPLGLVADAVIQSWQRCLALGLKPTELPDFEPVTRSRVNSTLARHHPLLHTAAPEFDQLDRMLAGTGCKAILTDRHGLVLRATPSSAGARDLLSITARVGVDVGEASFGSTAPGVCAMAGSACTVTGGEHFYGVLQEFHCAAAPIFNREGTLTAVLDLTVVGRPFGFDALALARLAAAAIENRFVAAQLRGHLVLRFQVAPAMLGTPLEGLAGIDGRGRVVWINAAGSALVDRMSADAGQRDVEAVFGITVEALLRRQPNGQPEPHRLPSGLLLWLAVGTTADGGRSETPLAALPTAPAERANALADVDRQHIETTLAACGGNISAAAKRLRVSRGLLYRRLRAWRAA
jgi:transcriptional regulator of acetoin/glycerol metabolism